MKQVLCDLCDKPATWSYMPGADYCCDEHVTRGCSCNQELKPGVIATYDEDGMPNNPTHDYCEGTDAEGRLLPCVEWGYCAEGFEDYAATDGDEVIADLLGL